MNNILRLCAYFLLCLSVCHCTPEGGHGMPATAPLTRDPYLQMVGPTSVTIVFRTRRDMKPSVWVSENGTAKATKPAQEVVLRRPAKEGKSSVGAKPLHSAPKGTVQYEITLTGLKPDTKYAYALFDFDSRITPKDPSYFLRTQPAKGAQRDCWIWVAGDGGTGGRFQVAVHEAMINFTKEKKITPDLFLHVGDMAYNDGLDSEFQGRFFEMYTSTLRNTALWPAMGNHEGNTSKGLDGVGPYFDAYVLPTNGERGGVPSGREAYYSFDYGQIHFVALDSCQESFTAKKLTPLGEEMMAWLKADLEKSKAQWLIAFFHHPPYTKGSHDSDTEYELINMRQWFMPVLESAGVDLVLTGHSHIYERSMLIDGAYTTPTIVDNVVLNDGDGDPAGDGAYQKSPGLNAHEGDVQIVAGNAGTGLSRKGTMPLMKRIILEHGSVLINVRADTLEAMMVDKFGKQRDVFQIQKKSKVAVSRVAQPKPAPAMEGPASLNEPKSEKSLGSDQESKKLPDSAVFLIAKSSEWRYLAGQDPAAGWNQLTYKSGTERWLKGRAGFGYGDSDDSTELDSMPGDFARVYARHEFTLTGKEDLSKLALAVSYDDAFIAYINGKEVARSGNIKGAGPGAKLGVTNEAEGEFELFYLDKAGAFTHPGTNILAIEGHNENAASSDFTLHPSLVLLP